MGIGTGPLVKRVIADQRRHALAEFSLGADAVDQAGGQRCLGRIAIRRAQPGGRVGGCQGNVGLWPGPPDIGFPRFEQGGIDCLRIFAGLGRLAVANPGLHRALVGANLEHVSRDLQPVEQAAKVKVVAARPHDQRAPLGIKPHFAGVGRQQQGIVIIGKSMDQHRLLRRPHPVHRPRHVLQADETATGEARQVQNHGLDPIVPSCRAQRMDKIARAVLAGRSLAAGKGLKRILYRRFFDHMAVQPQQQRSIAHCPGTGPGRKRSKKNGKEQQQEQQCQRILYPDQQPPDLACKDHRENPFVGAL